MGAFSTLSTYCLALLCITPLLSPWPEFHVCLLTRVNLLNDVLFLSACRYFEEACPRSEEHTNYIWNWAIPSNRRSLADSRLPDSCPSRFSIEFAHVFKATCSKFDLWLCFSLNVAALCSGVLCQLRGPQAIASYPVQSQKHIMWYKETMRKWDSTKNIARKYSGRLRKTLLSLGLHLLLWNVTVCRLDTVPNLKLQPDKYTYKFPGSVIALPILSSMH